jgi:hypothetical protein
MRVWEQFRHRFSQLRPILLTWAGLSAALLPALLPLLRGHLPWQADGLLHFYRLAQLDRAVRHGLLFPRWLPDLGFGFGFPLFNYYPPFSYYAVLPLTLLGLEIETAVRLSYLMALLLLAGGIYWWTRQLFGRAAGLVAALAAVYAPYILFDVHHRGVLPEVWGLAWLALALALLYNCWQQPRPGRLALLALSYAGLLLSHNILALVGTPLLLGYLFFLKQLRGDTRRIHRGSQRKAERKNVLLFIGLLFGLGLSAFFWLPAFFERELVQIHKLYDSANFYYGNHFLAWTDLVALPQTADPAQVNPAIPFTFGLLPLLLAALNLLPGQNGRIATSRVATTHRLALALLLGLFTLFMLPLSLPLWDRLPLVEFIQFPWRLLGPASLLLAVLAGAGVARLPSRWREPGAVLSSAAILLVALPWLFPASLASLAAPGPIAAISHEIETGALGTTAAGDYLPVQVAQLPPSDRLLPLYETAAPDYIIPRLDDAQLPPGVTIRDAAYGLTTATIHYRAEADFTAVFHWFYFPGWQATLNGRSHSLRSTQPEGLIQIDLPAGEHSLQVEFGSTPLRRGATAVSWLSLLLVSGAWWWYRNNLPPRRNGKEEKLSDLRAFAVKFPSLLLVALFGLGLSGVKMLYLDEADTIFRRSRFDGQQVSGVAHPLHVDFDQQLVLLGYDLATPELPADGLIDLSLYWRAAQPLAQEFSVAVHLLDEQGRRYGQQDSFHPAGLPTTRWQPAEYARDRHRLPPWPGTPPGQYRLVVRVYERENGRIRPILNDLGQPVATEYEITSVTITPPRRQPTFEPPRPLAASLHDGLRLLGTDALPASLQTGNHLLTTFYWQAQAQPTAAYRAQLQLVNEGGTTVAQQSWPPGRADFPTNHWLPGQLVRDEQRFLIPAGRLDDPTVPLPDGRYGLDLGLLNEAGQAMGQPVRLGELTITAPPRHFDLPAAVQPLAQDWILAAENQPVAQLRGYQLQPETITPGEPVSLTLYWQSVSPTPVSYSVFVHLLDEAGTILAQSDHIPAADRRPTAGWLPGEIVADTAVLFLPSGAPPGPYQFRLGLYDAATGQRLTLLNSAVDAIVLP